ncbi:hypothetical protein ACHAWX_005047, partial [Stephanocyclus meneghinianus]
MNFRSAIFCRAFLHQSPFTTVSVQINQLSGRAHTQLDYD